MAFKEVLQKLSTRGLSRRSARDKLFVESSCRLPFSGSAAFSSGSGWRHHSSAYPSVDSQFSSVLCTRQQDEAACESNVRPMSCPPCTSKPSLAMASRGAWRAYPVVEGLQLACSGKNLRSEVMVSRLVANHVQVRRISSLPRIFLQQTQAASQGVSSETEETGVKKKSKEASPEDCDQAVEGLTSVKARVKAANDAMKEGKGVVRASFLLVAAIFSRVWQVLLGIPYGIRSVASMTRDDWKNKLVEWRMVVGDTLQHYWVGTKLLWADIRISSRLLLKLANGKNLTRRERQQLTRTAADIFRLVPFAVFIIIPFMEFALPLALRLFPNMLPSTFQDKMKEEENLKRKLKARLEMAKFLQETVGEMAKEVKKSHSGDLKKTAETLQQFMTKVRTGERVTNEEILSFAKLFNDELTLDNITRSRLVSMCKYMGLQTFGTDAYLRYILRAKLAWIKEDDKMIQAESVESLTEAELRSAARERGMMGLLSVEEMQQQLRDWLDLSLNRAVPSSLLILSRAFLVGNRLKPEEVMSFTLSSLPDTVVEQVGASASVTEDPVAERKRKLEKLKEEEALIKEEEAQEKARLKLEEEEASRDHALEEMQAPASLEREAHDKAVEKAKAVSKKASSKRDDLCKLSAALATLAAGSSVAKERADFLRMVNQEIQLYNSMVAKEGSGSEAEAREAYRAAHEAAVEAAQHSDSEASTALISKVDSMLHKLEKELDDVDQKIGSNWKILDTDHDGKVTPEEVAAACQVLRRSLGDDPVAELISSLAKDQDGKILVEDIVNLGTMENVPEDHKLDPQTR